MKYKPFGAYDNFVMLVSTSTIDPAFILLLWHLLRIILEDRQNNAVCIFKK